MDATKWTQGFQEMISVKPMEHMIPTNTTQPTCTTSTRANNIIINNNNNNNINTNNNNNNTVLERKPRPQEKLNCPRCNSTNTKFCYYNNYSLTQPRYFCKGCRRYWTEGGSLRNVPVGGSSRKNKRSSSAILPSSSSSTSASSLSSSSSLGLTNKLPDLNPPILFSNQNPKTQKGSSQDLNLLSFPVMQDGHHHSNVSQFLQMPKMENSITQPNPSCSSSSLYVSSSPVSALELLRTGVSARGLNTFMPNPMADPNTVLYSSGFSIMPDYKTSNLSFPADHQGLVNNNGNNNNRSAANDNINGGRVLFPFGEMKELSTTTQQVDDHQQKNQGNSSTNAYWSGMFSTTGGPSW